MTVTERERRKDELLQCGVHRAELCVMVANLEYDLAQLEEENAKLLEERHEYQATIDNLVDECADQKAENVKLREQNHYLMKGDLLHVLTDQEYIDQCERERLMQVSIDALDKDNVKLRELVSELYQCSRQEGCDRCGYKDGCAMFDRMAQLGIEEEA